MFRTCNDDDANSLFLAMLFVVLLMRMKIGTNLVLLKCNLAERIQPIDSNLSVYPIE